MKYVDELNEAARRREVSQTHCCPTLDASFARVDHAYIYMHACLFLLDLSIHRQNTRTGCSRCRRQYPRTKPT